MLPFLSSQLLGVSAAITPLSAVGSVVACAIPIAAMWHIGATVRAAWQKTRKLHQIPCDRCQFFTQEYHLKCTVNPYTALSEHAIGCPDFRGRIL
jgi:hypothetical protein